MEVRATTKRYAANVLFLQIVIFPCIVRAQKELRGKRIQIIIGKRYHAWKIYEMNYIVTNNFEQNMDLFTIPNQQLLHKNIAKVYLPS